MLFMFKRVLLACVVCQLTLVACSLSREDDTEGGNLPDTVALNVRQVSVSANGRVEITADKVEAFYEDDYSKFYNVDVKELNEKREERLAGRAERIEVKGNRDGIAHGNIVVRNLEDESELRSDSMELNDEDRILVGKGSVQVDLGDGLTLESGEFIADLGKKTYTFSNGVTGTLIVGEDEPDKDE